MLVRTATLPPAAAPPLNTPVVSALPGGRYPVDLLGDGKTWLYRDLNGIAVATDPTVAPTLGHKFYGVDTNCRFQRGWELTNGKFLASLSRAGLPGELWIGDAWNRAIADAASWNRKLLCSGPDVFIREEWGVSIAPSWSKHAGAIFAAEYATVTPDTLGDPQTGSIRGYVAEDNGNQPFREIFNVLDHWAGVTTHVKTFGNAYDPWAGRLYISQGEGVTGKSGVWYTDDPLSESPTWTLVPGSDLLGGWNQITAMFATEAGIVMAGDSLFPGVWLLPRAAGRTGIGPMRQTALNIGDTVAKGFGTTIHRNGGLENPQAGAPLIVCFQSPGEVGIRPKVWVSYDGGRTLTEGYLHGSGITDAGTSNPGLSRLRGPALDGTVLGTLALDLTGIQQISLQHQPVPQKSATPPAQRLISFDLFSAPELAIDHGGNWGFTLVATAARNGYMASQTAAQGDYLAWDQFLEAGTYTVRVMGRTGAARGILSVQLDGTEVAALDFYAAATADNVVKTATFTVATTGLKRLMVKVTDKNTAGGSTGYQMYLNALGLLRQR